MSTERSRQRANRRSVDASTSKKTRKYHLTTVTPFIGDDDSWNGIVLPPRYVRSGPKNIVSQGTRYSLEGLLAHLFFWDQAAIPRPSKASKLPAGFDLIEYCHDQILAMPVNDRAFDFVKERAFEQDEFKGRKSIRRSEVYRATDLEWESQVQTFHALEKRNPGLWSIADPFFQHRKLITGRALMVRLYDAIPVPAQGVELLDVVEFKTRFRTELQNLRKQLSRLYLKIENSQDTGFAFQIEFSDLKDSIAELIQSMEKMNLPFTFVSIDNRLKWEFDYRAPIAAGIAGGTLGDLRIALAAAAAGFAANLIPKVEVHASRGKLTSTKNPLAYAYLISESFGGSLPYDSLGSKCFLEDEYDPPKPARIHDEWIIAFETPNNKVLDVSGEDTTFFLNTAMTFAEESTAQEYLAQHQSAISMVGERPNVKKLSQ